MARARRSFDRPIRRRSYYKSFIISTEGKTEEKYFSRLKRIVNNPSIHIECLKPDSKSAPQYVLKRLEKDIRKRKLEKDDEAWLVIDRDGWEEKDIQELCVWTQQHKMRFMALSHPCFEYWLLLHFTEGKNVRSAHACREQLSNEWPGYHKTSGCSVLTKEMISAAIKRAKRECRNNELPLNKKGTNVCQLVENILN